MLLCVTFCVIVPEKNAAATQQQFKQQMRAFRFVVVTICLYHSAHSQRYRLKGTRDLHHLPGVFFLRLSIFYSSDVF